MDSRSDRARVEDCHFHDRGECPDILHALVFRPARNIGEGAMSYLLVFSLGLIAGAYCVGLMNKKIEYDVPKEIAESPKEDPLDIEIDAIMAWNDAVLSVPIVKRPMVFGETRQ
jgi:hypothetical protein